LRLNSEGLNHGRFQYSCTRNVCCRRRECRVRYPGCVRDRRRTPPSVHLNAQVAPLLRRRLPAIGFGQVNWSFAGLRPVGERSAPRARDQRMVSARCEDQCRTQAPAFTVTSVPDNARAPRKSRIPYIGRQRLLTHGWRVYSRVKTSCRVRKYRVRRPIGASAVISGQITRSLASSL